MAQNIHSMPVTSVLLSRVSVWWQLLVERMGTGNANRDNGERGVRSSEVPVLVFRHICMLVPRFWCVLSALLLASPAAAQTSTPVGVWLHPNKRIEIEIKPCGDRLCAELVWLERPYGDDGLPRADVKNKNPALRTRPLLGLNVLQGLRAAGENNWEDGEIYNPDDGENYRARMSIEKGGDLRIRAFVLLPLLGKTLIWTPVRPMSALGQKRT